MELSDIKRNRTSQKRSLFIILASILLNLLFSWFNNSVLESPLFLDSIFTIFTAITLGPLAAVTVGGLTNIGMEVIYGFTGYYWPFAACNMLTGLIIGLMSRRGHFNKSIYLMTAMVIITFANAIVGSFVAYFVYGGYTDVQIDLIMDALTDTGMSLFTAAFWSRIPANLIDKMISVYLAFLIYIYYSKKNGDPVPKIL